VLLAGKLGDAYPHDDKLGRLDLERLLPVVADDLPLTMLGAELLVFGNGQDHLDPRQMGRKLFAPRRGALLPPPRVAFDGLDNGVGDAISRIGNFRGVAEVDHQLVRVVEVPLDPLLEGGLKRGREAELILRDRVLLLSQLLVLLRDPRVSGGERGVTLCNRRAALGNHAELFAEQPVAGFDIARQ
jgi:hypothetical protein